MAREHSITIPSRRNAPGEENKGSMEESDSRATPGMGNRDNPTEQPKIQLFYSEPGSDSRNVAGFGWMNDS